MDPSTTNSTLAETANSSNTTMEMNGHAHDSNLANEEGSANLPTVTPTTNPQNHNTYDALFPSLPVSAGKGVNNMYADGNPMGTKWGSKPMIISPTVTQVKQSNRSA